MSIFIKNMKKIIALVAAILLLVPSVWCFNLRGGVRVIGGCSEKGINYSVDRNLAEFSSVSSSGPFNVYYVQSEVSKVKVEGKKEFVDKLISKVDGGKLSLKLENGTYTNLVLKVTVYSPELNTVNLSGSGSFIDEGLHKTENSVGFHLSGSGNLKASKLECASFSAKISGSGRIQVGEIEGGDMEFNTSGSGRVEIGKLKSNGSVSLSHSGSGRGEIGNADIEGTLKLRISGSGSIVVNGRAGNVDASTSGSGDMHGNLIYQGINTHISGSGRINFRNE